MINGVEQNNADDMHINNTIINKTENLDSYESNAGFWKKWGKPNRNNSKIWWLLKPKALLSIAVVCSVLLSIAVFIIAKPFSGGEINEKFQADYSQNEEQISENNPANNLAIPQVIADVKGAVKKPGIVRLQNSARVIDAIEASGGLEKNADTSSINLAKIVTDGELIYVYKKGEVQNNTAQPTQEQGQNNPGQNNPGTNNSGKISINNASLAQLDELKGIGPALAQRIIDYRNQNGLFNSIEQITEVKGIGEALFNKIKEQICL